MAMTAEQITAELRRKAKLGLKPTDPSHMDEYNQIKAGLSNTVNKLKSMNPANSTNAAATTSTNAPVATDPGYSSQIKDLVGRLRDKLDQPRTTFNYNSDNDPALQAAESRVYRDANREMNNNLVSLGSRGIGNSASAVRDSGQIKENAVGYINGTLVPQYEQRAYQRYQDQNAADQSDLANLSNLINQLAGLDQQEFNQDQQQWQNRYNYGQAIGQFGNGQKTLQAQQIDYQTARDAIADERYKQQFDEDVRRYGLDHALQQAQLNNQISNAAADNQRADQSAAYNQFMDLWKTYNAAPYDFTLPNGYTVRKGDSFPDQTSSSGITQGQVNAYNSLLDAFTRDGRDPVEAYNFATSPQGKKNALDYGLTEGLYNQMVNDLKSRIPQQKPVDGKTSIDNLNYYQTQINNSFKDLTLDQAMQYVQQNSGDLSDSDYRALIKFINDNAPYFKQGG